jgi:glycerol uptake facilitator protein
MKQDNLAGELWSEFLGTSILMLCGQGTVAMTQLFGTGVPGEVVKGGYTNIVWGWGIAVVMGIYTAKLSGGHLNPAVTLTLAVFRGFSWRKVVPYWLAQTAAAFAASAVVFWNYRPVFQKVDPALENAVGVFTTVPAFPENLWLGFLDQVIGTAILLFLVFAIVESARDFLAPLLIGLVVVLIGTSFGAMHGYAINPARDFGPRLFLALAGAKANGLTDGSGIFWVPIAGPLLGGLIGAFVYETCIRRFLPKGLPQKTEGTR